MGSAAAAFGLFDIGEAIEVDAKVSSEVCHDSKCISFQT